MKKHIANIISASRIVVSLILFSFSEITTLFLALYIYCGFSDLIDGPIARKTGSQSVTGALLDTAGDVLTYFALLKILIVIGIVPFWALLWFGITLIGFCASAVIAKIRFKKFYFVHSFCGKILGVTVFALPLALKFINSDIYLEIICAVSSIAAVESIIIQLKSKSLKTDSAS
ncbi:MAG: CDP-alcohol phosphatidyltransferase family protein [Clostridiales bacterium]|nr:CDP-alcohol phosphatidyltransferase family protein [Clostridiales bacterium]